MYNSIKFQAFAVAALISSLVSGAPLVEENSNVGAEALVTRQSNHPSYTNDAEFKRVMLAAHTFFRDQHGLGGVTWNEQRATDSATHAKKCVFQHSYPSGAGENVAIGYGDAIAVVNAWTSGERPKYDYNNPGFSSATGHFTQVVWRTSTTVGCGRALCGNRWLVVCQYVGQGNILPNSNFASNVPRQVKGNPSDGYSESLRSRSLEDRGVEEVGQITPILFNEE